MNGLIILGIAVVVAIIMAIAGMCKDSKQAGILKKYLASIGFVVSEEIEVFDKDNQGKPFLFLIDRQNKKWSLAGYRATSTNIYDFADIINYSVTYRELGTEIVKGKEHTFTAADYSGECGIIENYNLKSDNCEYIEIRVAYNGQANNVCSHFILFEKQQTFINAQNNDFHLPSLCISNAKDFERMLHDIVRTNSIA